MMQRRVCSLLPLQTPPVLANAHPPYASCIAAALRRTLVPTQHLIHKLQQASENLPGLNGLPPPPSPSAARAAAGAEARHGLLSQSPRPNSFTQQQQAFVQGQGQQQGPAGAAAAAVQQRQAAFLSPLTRVYLGDVLDHIHTVCEDLDALSVQVSWCMGFWLGRHWRCGVGACCSRAHTSPAYHEQQGEAYTHMLCVLTGGCGTSAVHALCAWSG